MYVPLSWLNEYAATGVDPADRAAVRELGGVLDSLGLVIEGIEFVGEGLEHVVLARVLAIDAIEGADRIRRVLVDRGSGEPLEIVCGAMNVVVGDVVPLAQVGAELPGGFRIERRTMRGVTSDGMLCSGRELDLTDDQAGLMILASLGPEGTLPGSMVLGAPLAAYLGLEPDAIFDVAVEPNRPDALSIVGVARDLAARLGVAFTPPEPQLERTGPDAGSVASVETAAPVWCDRIAGRVLLGCEVVESPPYVRRRLEMAGMRPINAIVDASNYVMLELGQPTHPYDLARLGGAGIGVRLAEVGEELVTLDGERRILGIARDGSGDLVEIGELVITDAKNHAVGLAGVMGGRESEIGPQTRDVLLEVAHFDPVIVGRQAARHGIRTEASQRFWRGTDPDGIDRAADRFCELVVEASRAAGVTPPTIATGVLDDDRRAPGPPPIRLRTSRVNALLGTALDRDAIAALLEPIGFTTAVDGADLDVTVPGFRPDVTIEVNLIEEVARHYGYGRLTGGPRRSTRPGHLTTRQRRRRTLASILRSVGADEAWTSSLVDPAVEEQIGPDGVLIAVSNPIVHPETVLRTRVLPGLLGALRRNESHRNAEVRLFEIGRVFSDAAAADGRPDEREVLGLILADAEDDAGEAVRALGTILDGLGVAAGATELVPVAERDDPAAAGAHPTRSAFVVAVEGDAVDGEPVDQDGVGEIIGVVGEVDPEVLAALELTPRRVGWLALDLDRLFALATRPTQAAAVSGFPSSDLDLAFVTDEELAAHALEAVLRTAAGARLESIRLLDVYRGPSVPDGTRSLTYRLRLSALDHTLSAEEIQAVQAACIEAVETALPARLRS